MAQQRVRVLEILEATVGGTRTHLRHLLSRIDLERFDVTLAFSNERDPYFSADLKAFKHRGVTLIEVPMKREISPWCDLVAFFRLLNTIRKGRYDIVHTHSSKAGFLGRIAARLCRVPRVFYSPHAFAFQCNPESLSSRFYLFLEKVVSRFQNGLICVSEGERQIALKHGLGKPDHTYMIPNTISTGDIHPTRSPDVVRSELGIPASTLVVGMVAHFRPQKGYKHFIRAIPLVLSRLPETRFLLLGDGPELPEVANLVRSLNVEKSVILAGHREPLGDYYQVMSVFALSSLWEGMPYVILEAMAVGLPIVATNIVGNNELVVNNQTGFLVPIGDSQSIADCLIALLENDDKRCGFGQAARETAKDRSSIDNWIRAYESLYSHTIDSSAQS